MLRRLGALLGEWTTESTHPALPGTVVHGRATFEYLMPREQPSDTAFDEGSPGFAERFVGTFEDDGDTVVGRVQLSYDDENWQDDLETTYRRVSPRPDI